MINIVDLLRSKDPSLDVIKGLTTIDVAYMINDLSESIHELLSQAILEEVPCPAFDDNTPLFGKSGIYLTLAESLAKEVCTFYRIRFKTYKVVVKLSLLTKYFLRLWLVSKLSLSHQLASYHKMLQHASATNLPCTYNGRLDIFLFFYLTITRYG